MDRLVGAVEDRRRRDCVVLREGPVEDGVREPVAATGHDERARLEGTEEAETVGS